MSQYAIECTGITKAFDGVPVLRDITAKFAASGVTVLAGENGAGKSTLYKILAGQLRPDNGSLVVNGEPIHHFAPRVAQQAGVSIIPQELQPYPELAVYENLLVGWEIVDRFGFLKRKEMIARAKELIDDFGVEIDPRVRMGDLNTANTQLVEIIKATSRKARIVLMDEPTSSLTEREIERLFRVVRLLKSRGVTMLYTTHKMEEIAAIADFVAVLRDGRLITQAPAGGLTERQIVTDMVGREVEDLFPHRDWSLSSRGAVLEVQDFRVRGFGAANSFEVARGEIVGLGGLVGAGRSEMLEGLFGVRHAEGRVSVNGRQLKLGDPNRAIQTGIAMVPEDRKLAGVVLPMSILDNMTLPRVDSFIDGGVFVNDKARRRKALEVLGAVRAKYAGLRQLVSHLSGGNQQKIALARWLMAENPKLLILDEPTRGIDVGARAELYRIIVDLALDEGLGILLASSDMYELLNLCHRVLVFRGGAIVGDVPRAKLNQETILRLAMGLESEVRN
jgi:ribose transport system ATP-binding protein